MSTPTKKITELGEQEVPLYADDFAVVVTDTGTTPTTKRTKLSTLRRFMLGIASVGTLVFPEQNVHLGTDVTGTDAAAADVVIRGPIGTSEGAPAAIIYEVATRGTSGSGSTAQTRAEALRVQEVANASGREVALWNPSGPVMGGFPLDSAVSLFGGTEYGRFLRILRVVRFDGGGTVIASSANGTAQTPTPKLNGEIVAFFAGQARHSASSWGTVGGLSVAMREDATGTALGGVTRLRATPIGATAVVDILGARSGGTNIAELVSEQATFRLIPGATLFAVRDSTNAADAFSLNGAGTTALFPLATSFVVGADPGGSALLRVGGGATFNGAPVVVGAASSPTGSPRLAAVGGTIQLILASVLTDATRKISRFGFSHHLNAEEPIGGIVVDANTTTNEVLIGGGSGSLNAATRLGFYAASNNTTTTGTEVARMTVPAAGETSLWLYDADNATLERVTVGAADSGGAGFKVLRIPN